MFIDTHCHLNFNAFDDDLDEVLKRAHHAGVKKIIIPGAKIDSSRKAVEIAEKHPGCYAVVGVHPHHAGLYSDTSLEQLTEELTLLARNPNTVAIGEIGMDYFQYKNSPAISESDKKLQKQLFLLQLGIASKLSLPAVIHCRDAHDDLISVISQYMGTIETKLRGVFHCFGGNKDQLKQVLELGFFIGFDGNITYKDNEPLRDVVLHTPLERLLLETDAPYLTPLLHRGNRNEPSYLPLIAACVADIHHISIEEIAVITASNAERLFRLHDTPVVK